MFGPRSARFRRRSSYQIALTVAVVVVVALLVVSGTGMVAVGLAPATHASSPGGAASATVVPFSAGTGASPASAGSAGSLPIGVAAGSVAYTLAPWANYAAAGYHKILAESQIFGPAAYDPLTGAIWIAQSNPDGYEVSAPIITVNATTLLPSGLVTTVTNSSGLVYVPADHSMYVSDPGTDQLLAVNATTGAVEARTTVGPAPGNLSYNPSDSLVYVANTGNGTVVAVNTTNGLQTWSHALGGAPSAIAYDPVSQNVAVVLGSGLAWLNGKSLYNRTFFGVPSGPSSVAIDQQGWAYVGDVGGDMFVFNLTVAEAGPVGLGGSNADAAVFDAGIPAVVFTDRSTNEITVVSSLTQTVIAEDPIASSSPTYLVLVPGSHQVDVVSSSALYAQFQDQIYNAPNPLGRTIQAVDDLTGAVNISSRNLAAAPTSIAYDPDGGRVVVADEWSNNLSLVSAANPSSVPTTQVFVNGSAGDIGYDPVTHTLWVPMQVNINSACCGAWIPASVILVLNASTGAEVTEIFPSPQSEGGIHGVNGVLGVLYDPGTNTMIVFYNNNGPIQLYLEEFNPSTYAVTSLAPLPLSELCCNNGVTWIPSWSLDAVHHQLYVTSPYTDQLYIVDTQTLTIEATVTVGTQPLGVAYDSADGDAYVANYASANMTIVNGTSMKVVVGNVPFDGLPQYVVYDPSTELLYVGVQAGVGLWPINMETTLVVLDGSSLGAVWGPWPTIYVGYFLFQTPQTATFVPSTDPNMPGQIWNTNMFDGSVTVISIPPWVTSLVPSAPSVEAGQTLDLTTTVVGGTDGWTAAYAGLPPGCTSSSTLELSCTPTAAGTYTIGVTVTDGFGETSSARTNVTVTSGLALHASVSSSAIDLGATVWGNATTTGGSSPVNLTWAWGDGSVSWGLSVTHVYAAAGLYSVNATARDANGEVQVYAASVLVDPLPTLTIEADGSSFAVHQTVAFASTVSGGTGPFSSVYWTFGDASTATGPAATHVYTAPGTYTVKAYVTDGRGVNVSASVSVTVTALAPLAVSLTLGANQTASSAPVSLVASASGGLAPYTYAWTVDGATQSATGATFTYTPTSVGNYSIGVTVTDSVGTTAHAGTVLQVVPPPKPVYHNATMSVPVYHNTTAQLGTATLAGLAGGGLALGLVVGLVIGFLFSRRRAPPATKTEAPTTEAPAKSAPADEEEKGESKPAPEDSSKPGPAS